MIGKPKFKLGEYVSFSFGDIHKEGVIYIIDKYGTIEDDSDVSYDILNAEENILYKHINEKYVSKKSFITLYKNEKIK